MPQLDKVTFFSQFFWLCFFFFAFYQYALKNFLPEMSRILKFRVKRLAAKETSNKNHEIEENLLCSKSAERLLDNTIKCGKKIFKQNKQNRLDLNVFDQQTSSLPKEVKKEKSVYLKSIGESAFSLVLSRKFVLPSDESGQPFLAIKLAQQASRFALNSGFKDKKLIQTPFAKQFHAFFSPNIATQIKQVSDSEKKPLKKGDSSSLRKLIEKKTSEKQTRQQVENNVVPDQFKSKVDSKNALKEKKTPKRSTSSGKPKEKNSKKDREKQSKK